jgi:two-component system cell cycle response regulator DivK
MDTSDNKEHRKEKRINIKKDVLIDNKVLFKGIDISRGGLYVYTDTPFAENSVLNVTIPFKDKSITVKARVQHIQSGIGMGLKFIDQNDEQITLIQELIKSVMDESEKLIDSTKRKKILLVEQNDMSRMMHKNKLFMEGFSIIEAKNGIEALNLLKEHIPELIILDRTMEGIDGLKVLSILKLNPQWKDIPVIVCSDRADQGIVEEIIRSGADECLLKIMTPPSKLAETAKILLQRK